MNRTTRAQRINARHQKIWDQWEEQQRRSARKIPAFNWRQLQQICLNAAEGLGPIHAARKHDCRDAAARIGQLAQQFSELVEACRKVYDDPYTTCACAEKLRKALANVDGKGAA